MQRQRGPALPTRFQRFPVIPVRIGFIFSARSFYLPGPDYFSDGEHGYYLGRVALFPVLLAGVIQKRPGSVGGMPLLPFDWSEFPGDAGGRWMHPSRFAGRCYQKSRDLWAVCLYSRLTGQNSRGMPGGRWMHLFLPARRPSIFIWVLLADDGIGVIRFHCHCRYED